MRAIKGLQQFVPILAAWWVAIAPAHAAAQQAGATGFPSRLDTEVQTVSGPGLITTSYACVTYGSNHLAFRILQGYAMDLSVPDRITLATPDFSRTVLFRVLDPLSSGPDEDALSTFRRTLWRQHPGAKIRQEFSLRTLGQNCPSFEFDWSGPGGVAKHGIAVFMPTSDWVVEFDLLASQAVFTAGRHNLNELLLSFRTGKGAEKLKLPVIYNKS